MEQGIRAIALAGVASLLSPPVYATAPDDPFAVVTDECATERLDPESERDLETLVRSVDNASIGEVAQTFLQLAQTGATNLCDLERRLRRYGQNTRLLALPLSASGEPRRLSIVYPPRPVPPVSVAPRYYLWIERGGQEAAQERLRLLGLAEDGNLLRLRATGVLVDAESHHDHYTANDQHTPIAADDRYAGLYSALEEYRASGVLDDSRIHRLMYAINDSFPFTSQKFSINGPPSLDRVQFYVIREDPRRLLVGLPCSCALVPDTRTVLCDAKLLDALDDWVAYAPNEDGGAAAILGDINAAGADFLLHWLVAHELGHLERGHDYGANFLAFDQTLDSASDADTTRPDIRSAELEADTFAVKQLPPELLRAVHMTVSFLLQDLYSLADPGSSGARDASSVVTVRDPVVGHPNLLSRVFLLWTALKASNPVFVDNYLDALGGRLRTSNTDGIRLPPLCGLKGATTKVAQHGN